MNIHNIPQIKHTDSGSFFLLAGPCAIEGEEMAMQIAEKLVGITDKLEIPFVFKGSFTIQNRQFFRNWRRKSFENSSQSFRNFWRSHRDRYSHQ